MTRRDPRRPDRRRPRRARPRRHRARARGGLAAARERRGGPRGAAVDGLRHRGRGRALAGVARRAGRRAAASCARATAGSPSRRRATRRRSCAAGWRRWGPCSSSRVDDEPLLRELEAEGVGAARAHRRPRGLVRPPAARAHPPLHARPAAARDRARHRGAVPALPRLLAARGPASTALDGPARRGRGRRAARGVRGAGGGVGGERPARARARLQARVARPAHALGEVAWARLWGAGAVAGAPHADRARARATSSTPGRRSRAATARPRRRARPRARSLDVLDRARRDVLPGARARHAPARRPSVEEGLGALVGRGARDLRLVRRAALAAGAGLAADGRPGCPAGAGAWSPRRRRRPRPRPRRTPSSWRARCCAAPASSSAAR